ncbi:hypothetical protein CRENBAI_007935 [Crenichthys baileyi]|uniref:Uncharacterized protein n=1 Tax=Crenichthys baileyi TaxID=28760 RepID=A0AAV9S139_9TELE
MAVSVIPPRPKRYGEHGKGLNTCEYEVDALCIPGFSTKICNSEGEDPPGLGGTLRRSKPQTSKAPQSTGTPGETHRQDYRNPQRRAVGRSQGSYPAATVQKP